MNFTYWLNLPTDLILVAPDASALEELEHRSARFHVQVGILGPRYPLLSALSVLENIGLMAMYHRGLSEAATHAELHEPLDRLGLTHIRHDLPHTLNGEQTLRVAILRCVAKKNSIVVMNTPSLGTLERTLQCRSLLQPSATADAFRLWILCTPSDLPTYANHTIRTLHLE